MVIPKYNFFEILKNLGGDSKVFFAFAVFIIDSYFGSMTRQ